MTRPIAAMIATTADIRTPIGAFTGGEAYRDTSSFDFKMIRVALAHFQVIIRITNKAFSNAAVQITKFSMRVDGAVPQTDVMRQFLLLTGRSGWCGQGNGRKTGHIRREHRSRTTAHWYWSGRVSKPPQL